MQDSNSIVQSRGRMNMLEGELLLQALNGFVLVVTSDAHIFYVSSTIQDYLGFQQSDIIHQCVYELIHTEDRPEFQRQIHWALNPIQSTDSGQIIQGDNGFQQIATYYNPDQLPPENSSFMERNFICRLRCLLDNSSGFLAMNFQGRLKFLHGQNKKGKDGTVISPQLALFAVATPLQPPSILEIRTKNFIFRTKHKLDFTPIGCDAKGRIVLGYTEAELCMRGTGYQFIHAADMLYCAENHVRMIKTGESGMTVFRLLTKENRWAWVQANARLVYKNGRPDYIIATQRPLTEEEGAEHLRKRNMKLPFMFATGEAVLYEVTFPQPGIMDSSQTKVKSGIGKGAASKAALCKESVDPSSLLGAMLQQDESVYLCPPALNKISLERDFFADTRGELNSMMARNWQDALLSAENNSILKQELADCPQDSNLMVPEENIELFQDNKNSELLNIMNILEIDYDDIDLTFQQDDELLKNDFAGVDDTRDGDITDEILTYVQESLNKTDVLYSSCQQQESMFQNSACLMQQQIDQQQIPTMMGQQLSQQLPQQQQLCQKMKHMQVNGMFTDWNSLSSSTLNTSQQQLQPFDFSDMQEITQEFPYKSEDSTASYACREEYTPFKQSTSMMPQFPDFTEVDFFTENFNLSTFPSSSDLDFLNCFQVPESQSCDQNSQQVAEPSEACYAGALSMYQCGSEAQANRSEQMQYDPVLLEQEPSSKFQSMFAEESLRDDYLQQLNVVSTQPGTHLQPLHNSTESRSFSDFASNGFL
ncbi:aryl hydrocarbon receptor isoform X2 [Erythrolamprus reginae]